MPALSEKTATKKKGRATSADEKIGRKLRQKRILMGVSQEKLARAVDVTFQQIQKYENGANRISASRLQQICDVLDVPVSFFFDNNEGNGKKALSEGEQSPFNGKEDLLERRETYELLRVYYSIDDPELRKSLLNLVKNMAQKMDDSNE
jgi:transcriptional regulator with XRE-family HTH domain